MRKWKSTADEWRQAALDWEAKWHVTNDRLYFEGSRADSAEADLAEVRTQLDETQDEQRGGRNVCSWCHDWLDDDIELIRAHIESCGQHPMARMKRERDEARARTDDVFREGLRFSRLNAIRLDRMEEAAKFLRLPIEAADSAERPAPEKAQ